MRPTNYNLEAKGVHAEGNFNLNLEYDVQNTLQFLKGLVYSYVLGLNYWLLQGVQKFWLLFKNELIAGKMVV